MSGDFSVGATRSCAVEISAPMVEAFATLSGDVNPLHVDATYAAAQGYSRPVAHGMLSLAAISRLIGTELPGPGALWIAQRVQFQRPVFVGDRVIASVTIERVSEAAGLVELRTDVRLERTSETVLTGTATVRVPADDFASRPPTPAAVAPAVAAAAVPAGARVAVVTGGSRGLGRAIAVALAEDGLRVLVHGHSREADAAATVEAIAARGGTAHACLADLADADGVDHLFDEAIARFGRVDVLVNNATPPIVLKSVLDCTWEDVQVYLDVYVRSTLRLAQRAIPGMQERRFGRMVNVLSSYALGVPPARMTAYLTAKAALAGLSKSLAVELGPAGITVNMIAPSTAITEQTESMSPRARQLHAAQTPLRRLASAADVAAAARYLASDAAAFVTGAILPVAGGTVMS